MQSQNGSPLEIKSQKATVISLAFKKLKEVALILATLETSVQDPLMFSASFFHLEPLGVS